MGHPYILTGAAVSAIIISPFLSLIYITWSRISTIPPGLPWVGLKNKWFLPKLRACLRDITAGREPLDEGYKAYGQHAEAFVVPGFHWPAVVLPPADILWLATQPDNVINNANVQDEILGLKYLAHGPDLAAQTDFSVLRRDLTRQASRILPDIIDEMTLAFNEELATVKDDEERQEVRMFHVIEAVSRRFNNRLFVGLPLCRDKKYISGLATWELCFGICSALIRHLTPKMFQPMLGPITGIPCKIQVWRLKKYILDLIRQRVAARNHSIDSKGSLQQPNDVLQWLIEAKLDGRDQTGMTLDDIAGKAIILNFFSVHTISINASLILTNILLLPNPSPLLSQLRSEAQSILPHLPTNPRLIRKMTKLDSVIRESLRMSNMTGRGLDREVTAPAGVTSPSGVYLPRGTHVCANVSSRQVDSEVWEQGEEFVPMRFYKGDDAEGEEENEKARHAVHVTEDFLSFGLGKHACPGRFYAVQALKIMLGHLIINYDFEPLQQKPESINIGDAMVPSDKATMKMRRRQQREDTDDL